MEEFAAAVRAPARTRLRSARPGQRTPVIVATYRAERPDPGRRSYRAQFDSAREGLRGGRPEREAADRREAARGTGAQLRPGTRPTCRFLHQHDQRRLGDRAPGDPGKDPQRGRRAPHLRHTVSLYGEDRLENGNEADGDLAKRTTDAVGRQHGRWVHDRGPWYSCVRRDHAHRRTRTADPGSLLSHYRS